MQYSHSVPPQGDLLRGGPLYAVQEEEEEKEEEEEEEEGEIYMGLF